MGAVSPGEILKVGNCTPLAWSSFGHPEVYYHFSYNPEFVTAWCQVSDGPEAAYRIYFEMKSCSRGDFYSWTTYHSCCQNRTTPCAAAGSTACLNGGTCYDWSDVGPGEYRCDCPPLYVGDRCEIQSQLPCNSSDAMYLSVTGRNYNPTPPFFNCTPRYQFALNQPVAAYEDVINGVCRAHISRPSDGHNFIQGTDGQIKPPNSQFEVLRCERGDVYSWVNYHICCPSCLSSPCQNDGYCIQKSYNSYICRCRFGYGGPHCEYKLDVCVVSGDPHYRSFDDFMYSYQGVCKHVLVNTSTPLPGLPRFTVYGKNQHTTSTVVSNPQNVQIEYGNMLITLPNSAGYIWSFNTPDSNIRVLADDIYSIIFVSSQYRGSLSGLCGNNDNIRDNDLTKSDGTNTTNVDDFADSWIVPDPSDVSGSCPTKKRRRRQTVPTCEPLQEYRDKCSIINNTNGVFGRCIAALPTGIADQYYADCLMDACYSNGSSICKTIKVFAIECRAAGAQVLCDTWKLSSGCADTDLCPNGMAFKCSVSPCPATCQDPNAPDDCPISNMEGCGCEPGELKFNGSCVTECPVHCFYEPARHFMFVNDTYPGPSCTTIMCKECDNCTNGAEVGVLAGCQTGQRCYGGTCQMTTPRDHDNNRKSTPPGLINNTHAQACGNGNGNCDHTASPHIPPGQEKTLLPGQKPIKPTNAPPKNGKNGVRNGNSNGGGKGKNKGKATGKRKTKKSNRRKKN